MKEKRIYLRALEPSDYEVSILWRKDEGIWDMVGGPKYFVSKEYEKEWVWEKIHSQDQIVLAACERETDNYIGNASLTNMDWINRSCQAHLMIGERSAWGKGYGKEALDLLLHFAFMERGFHRVESAILESNIGSRKMFEKCGFKKEGVLRKKIYKNGIYIDQCAFSILDNEYREARNI